MILDATLTALQSAIGALAASGNGAVSFVDAEGLRAVLAGVLTDEDLLRKAGLLRADGELTRWGRVMREHVQEGASASSREPAAPTGAPTIRSS